MPKTTLADLRAIREHGAGRKNFALLSPAGVFAYDEWRASILDITCVPRQLKSSPCDEARSRAELFSEGGSLLDHIRRLPFLFTPKALRRDTNGRLLYFVDEAERWSAYAEEVAVKQLFKSSLFDPKSPINFSFAASESAFIKAYDVTVLKMNNPTVVAIILSDHKDKCLSKAKRTLEFHVDPSKSRVDIYDQPPSEFWTPNVLLSLPIVVEGPLEGAFEVIGTDTVLHTETKCQQFYETFEQSNPNHMAYAETRKGTARVVLRTLSLHKKLRDKNRMFPFLILDYLVCINAPSRMVLKHLPLFKLISGGNGAIPDNEMLVLRAMLPHTDRNVDAISGTVSRLYKDPVRFFPELTLEIPSSCDETVENALFNVALAIDLPPGQFSEDDVQAMVWACNSANFLSRDCLRTFVRMFGEQRLRLAVVACALANGNANFFLRLIPQHIRAKYALEQLSLLAVVQCCYELDLDFENGEIPATLHKEDVMLDVIRALTLRNGEVNGANGLNRLSEVPGYNFTCNALIYTILYGAHLHLLSESFWVEALVSYIKTSDYIDPNPFPVFFRDKKQVLDRVAVEIFKGENANDLAYLYEVILVMSQSVPCSDARSDLVVQIVRNEAFPIVALHPRSYENVAELVGVWKSLVSKVCPRSVLLRFQQLLAPILFDNPTFAAVIQFKLSLPDEGEPPKKLAAVPHAFKSPAPKVRSSPPSIMETYKESKKPRFSLSDL